MQKFAKYGDNQQQCAEPELPQMQKPTSVYKQKDTLYSKTFVRLQRQDTLNSKTYVRLQRERYIVWVCVGKTGVTPLQVGHDLYERVMSIRTSYVSYIVCVGKTGAFELVLIFKKDSTQHVLYESVM